MDQLQAMRAFSRVVEAGSFTRAADSLSMPNATLSKLVRELETHLGVRLLQRTTRRVTVTPDGQAYYASAIRLLRDLEDIDGRFNAQGRKPRGHLRVDIGGSTARDVLIPLLPDFMARYPDIRFDLGVSDRPADLIGDNIDCVIRGGAPPSSTLVARSLGQAEMLTCASPAYLKRFGVPAYPEELANGHRLIAYLTAQHGRAMPFRFQRDAQVFELKAERYVGINESNAHTAACVAGLGLIQTFRYAAAESLAQGTLVEVLQRWRPPPFPFHVLYPQHRHVSQRLRVFIDWLVECMPPRLAASG
ncbi:LysR family transcriptional regulator [Pseudoxanthomonas sp. GM95]|uniref:LysR family transcriptional regulator n=1 Tax=Pseudoxanthomonas sp. GM95 TaxID=1881043 RepID=UPI000B872D60|nr:LysR family transcriptional regulator [Pseudoxanthomonas sp. GM95]